MFKRSYKELKNTRTMVLCALLLAVAVAVEIVNPLAWGKGFKIRFDFIELAIIGYLTGPVTTAIAAGVYDIVRTLSIQMITGEAYNPAFTPVAIIGGFIYGFFLYRRRKNCFNNRLVDLSTKCFVTKLLINSIINIFLNSLLVKIFYNEAYKIFAITRIWKNAVLLPVEVIVMVIAIRFVDKYLKKYI